MNQPPGPWALVRHMWTRNFQANPLGTVAGSVLAVGAVAFMLFFGFFVVVALVVMGGLIMLSQALFRPARRDNSQDRSFSEYSSTRSSENKNNELEGEYEVISKDKTDAD